MLARKGKLRRGSGPAPKRAFRSDAYARPKETTPEGANAGTTPAEPPGQSERIEIMTRKSTPTNTQPASARSRTDRQPVTLELVARLAPHQGLADNLVRTFGLEPVDYDGIRDATLEHITQGAQTFGTALNEKALQIHLQRIVGSFVSSAFGAAQFYGTKKSAAMELTSRLLNDDRDEDRDGPIGFDSKAERARQFAAEMALQSFALLAAAEGAIAAYADVTGETWKPYEAPLPPAGTVSRQSAAAEMAAFQAA
jgi:hypothetical protein